MEVNNMEKHDILNISILSVSLNELLANLKEGVVFTPNVDHLMKLQKDRSFYEAYKKADWVICDSKILGLAAKVLNKPFKEVIPGSSLLPAFFEYHKTNEDVKTFLLGSLEGIALQAKKKVNEKTGRKIVVGGHSPSFGFEKNEAECLKIVDIINESGANVLIVGVGAPKQENWIMKYRDKLPNVKLFMALGATIDFEADHIKRAPSIYQKLHIEWYYRLIKEPKRLWRRYLIDDLPFVWYVMQQKLGLYKDPFLKK
jgi:N-acetylglucosaminyldiphosphoundecaprenol N-acetyl-beta-D-mannosaminyltransferase